MTTSPLTAEERQYLLNLARSAIRQGIRQEPLEPPPAAGLTPRLSAPGAAFVTLHNNDGSLRGCIGSLQARRALVADIQHNAQAAALADPRFSSVSESELPSVHIEISLLSKPEPLDFSGPEDLISKLRPHIDGVLMERGWNRGTFLPQVWQQLPAPEQFLRHLCLKAGLATDAWKQPGIKLSTYQVEKFGEAQIP